MRVRYFTTRHSITGEDDVASMFEKLSVDGADLLIETLPALLLER